VEPALRDRVFAVIKRTVHIDPSTLDASREIRDQVSFDSMQFVALTAAIEKELAIELPVTVMEARTLSEFLRVVDEAMK
jgi:acyl carrier protein